MDMDGLRRVMLSGESQYGPVRRLVELERESDLLNRFDKFGNTFMRADGIFLKNDIFSTISAISILQYQTLDPLFWNAPEGL